MSARPDAPLPLIPPIAADGDQPFWSVMIPTSGRTHYLEATLTSVLQQDPGPVEMHIEVVDNGWGDEVQTLVERLGGGRVSLYQQPARVHMSENWNTCLVRGRGQWLHVLHDDDIVLPGYYQRLREAIEHEPDVGAAFCRHIHIDAEGHWQSIAPLEQSRPGVLSDWLARIAVSQRVQAAAIVVRRDVYETLGGFRADLRYAADWEMWKRVAAHCAVWYEPTPLACYRVYASSETSRLVPSGATIADTRRAIDVARSYLPTGSEAWLTRKAREQLAVHAVESARRLLAAGHGVTAATYVSEALRSSRSIAVLAAVTRFAAWAAARTAWRVFSR